ncbi:MAG: glycosyltransferase family 4 protein [Thermoplasmatales archaeon]|nr:MAG: glycosyltransferase family 4 protein [Thermoplasmatales archaeon]
MRILWLTHRDPLNPKAGGAERIVCEIGTYLSKNENKITILTGGWPGCKRVDSLNGIKIIRFGRRVIPHLVAPVFLIKNEYDLVIADLGHAVPWISPVIFKKRVIVSFVHLHARSLPGQVSKGLAFLIKGLEKLYFIIYRKEDFITISKTSALDLETLGISKDKISIINPGVNNELFKPNKKTEYPTLVYFGGMRAYKRPNESLFLIRELSKRLQNLRLIVIGDGIMKKEMEDLTVSLGIEKDVYFKGRLSDNEVADIVSASWLNIHTSTTEGWGISIIEAAASGTPTVAYDVPGVHDSVQEGMNGIRVNDGDRSALVEASYKILKSPEKWWASSIEVAKNYSWEKSSELWGLKINEILNKHTY